MIVLDTTVLVYATGSEHRFRLPCRRLIDAIANGSVVATTTVEVLQEFAHVRARRRGRDDATTLTREFIDLLSPLLTVDEAVLRHGLDLYLKTARVGAFDAVLAAASIAAETDALVSADKAFSAIPALVHVLPTDEGLAALL